MSRQIQRWFTALGLMTALALLATPAAADPISLDILNGSQGGFRFSVLHTARGSGTGFAMSGATSSGLSGSLVGDYDGASKITGLTGTLTGKVGSTGLRNHINAFWAGTDFSTSDSLALEVTDGGLVDFGAAAGGFLRYNLYVDGTLINRGDLFFYPTIHVAGTNPSANDMTIGSGGREFSMWGNNFKNTGVDWTDTFDALGNPSTIDDNKLRLGIDLSGATTNPVPEPGSLVLIGLGVAGLAIARRRRNRNS